MALAIRLAIVAAAVGRIVTLESRHQTGSDATDYSSVSAGDLLSSLSTARTAEATSHAKASSVSQLLRGALPAETPAASEEVSADSSAKRSLQSVTEAFWRPLEWGPCSRPCAGGIQTRLVVCILNVTDRVTDAGQCPTTRPPRRQDCNLQVCPSLDTTEFSCDAGAIGGAQRCGPLMRDGGRLSITVFGANNVPNSDAVFAGYSDPYIVVRAGGSSFRTRTVRGAVNPRWGAPALGYIDPNTGRVTSLDATGQPVTTGEDLFVGLRMSTSPLTIEVWDADSGLEGSDDLLAVMQTTVIACSFASTGGCAEKTWLPFSPGQDCFIGRNATRPNPAIPCLQIQQTVVPHNVTLDPLEFVPALNVWNISLSMSNTWSSVQRTAAMVHNGDGDRVNTEFAPFAPAKQGIILAGRAQPIVWNFTNVTMGANIEVNYKSWVYFFRYSQDGTWDAAEPPWLARQGWSRVDPRTGLQVLAQIIDPFANNPARTDHQYRAHALYVPSFQSFRIEAVADHASLNRSQPIPARNAFIVVRMVPDDITIAPVAQKRVIELVLFAQSLPKFLIPQLILLLLILPFCWEVKFRMDLVQPYLATRALPHLRQSQRITVAQSLRTSASALLDTLCYCCRKRAKRDLTVQVSSEFVSPFSREHVLASALLEHPETYRAENARRRRLMIDVAAFFHEVRIVETDPLDERPLTRAAGMSTGLGAAASGSTAADMTPIIPRGSTLEAALDAEAAFMRVGGAEGVLARSGSRGRLVDGRRVHGDDSDEAARLGLEEEDYEQAQRGEKDRRESREADPSGEVRGFFNDIPVPPILRVTDLYGSDGGDGSGPGTAAWHRSLFWLTSLVYLLCLSPWIVCAAHGIVLLRGVSPPAMGLSVLFVGTALYLLLWGLGQWAANGYKVSSTASYCLFGACFLLLSYPGCAVVTDSAPLDLRALTLVSALASFVPLSLLAFLHSEALSDSLGNLQGLSKFGSGADKEQTSVDATALSGGGGGGPGKGLGAGRKASLASAGPTVPIVASTANAHKQAMPVHLPATYGVPAEAAPALASALGSAGAVCIEHAVDPEASEAQAAAAKAKMMAQHRVEAAEAGLLQAIRDAVIAAGGDPSHAAMGKSRRGLSKRFLSKKHSKRTMDRVKVEGKTEEESGVESSGLGFGRGVGIAAAVARGVIGNLHHKSQAAAAAAPILMVEVEPSPTAIEAAVRPPPASSLASTAGGPGSARAGGPPLMMMAEAEEEGGGAEPKDPSNPSPPLSTAEEGVRPSLRDTPVSLPPPAQQTQLLQQREAVEEGEEVQIEVIAVPVPGVATRQKMRFVRVSGVRVWEGHVRAQPIWMRAVIAARADLIRSEQALALAAQGTSLGLNEREDAALRMAAVASAPWLVPGPSHARVADWLGHDPLQAINARSHTSVLGRLLGGRVYTPLQAAPNTELLHADGLNGLMACTPGYLQRLTRFLCVLIALLHVTHAIIVGLRFTTYRLDGLSTAISLAIQDYVLLTLLWNKLVNRSPLWFCLLSLIARAFLASYAGQTWVTGQASAYATWACALGYEAGVHRLPSISDGGSELITLLCVFSWGEEYAAAVRHVNDMAATFQLYMARVLRIDIERDNAARKAAAEKAAKAKAKKKKKKIGPDGEEEKRVPGESESESDSSEDENGDRKDPYAFDLTELRARAAALRATKPRGTPHGHKYAKKGPRVGAAVAGEDDGKNTKVTRFHATRIIEQKMSKTNAQGKLEEQAKAKQGAKDKLQSMKAKLSMSKNSARIAPAPSSDGEQPAGAGAGAGAGGLSRMGSRSRSMTPATRQGDSGTAEDHRPPLSSSAMPTASGSAAPLTNIGGSATSAVSAMPIPEGALSARQKQGRTMTEEILALRQAWAGLAWLTLAFIPVLFADAVYEEYWLWWASIQPRFAAGLFDSSTLYTPPTVTLFGVPGVKAWVVAVACVGVSWVVTLMAGAASAWRQRNDGMLPSSFDLLLPFVNRRTGAVYRMGYPQFLTGLTMLVSVGTSILIFLGTGSTFALLFTLMIMPITILFGCILLVFLANGWSLLEPGFKRIPMTRGRLAFYSGKAGYLFGNKNWMKRWRQSLTERETNVMKSLEYDRNAPPNTRERLISFFNLPIVTGEDPLHPSETLETLTAKMEPYKKSVFSEGFVDARAPREKDVLSKVVEEEDEDSEMDEAEKKKSKRARAIAARKRTLNKLAGKDDAHTWKVYLRKLYYRWQLARIDPASMTFTEAFLRGYLTRQDHLMLLAVLLLFVLLFVLGLLAAPMLGDGGIAGNMLWIVPTTLGCTLLPVLTYSKTKVWTQDLLRPLLFAVGLSSVTTLSLLLEARNQYSFAWSDATAYALSIWSGYWAVTGQVLGWTTWRANGYKTTPAALLAFYFSYGCFAGVVFVAWAWGSYIAGTSIAFLALLLWAVQSIGHVLWSVGKGALPAWFDRWMEIGVAAILFTAAIVPALIPSVDFYYSASVGLCFLMLFYGARAVARYRHLTAETQGGRTGSSDTPIIFGPLLLPVFSYDPSTADLVDESRMVYDAVRALAVGLGWGIYTLMTLDTVLTGVAALCTALAVTLLAVLHLASTVPQALGSIAAFLDPAALRGARIVAIDAFFARRKLLPAKSAVSTSDHDVAASVLSTFAVGCSGMGAILKEAYAMADGVARPGVSGGKASRKTAAASASKLDVRSGYTSDTRDNPLFSWRAAGVLDARSSSPTVGGSRRGLGLSGDGSQSARQPARSTSLLAGTEDDGLVGSFTARPDVHQGGRSRSEDPRVGLGRLSRMGDSEATDGKLRAERDKEISARVSEQLAWLDPSARDPFSIRHALIQKEIRRRARLANQRALSSGKARLGGGDVIEPVTIKAVPQPYGTEQRLGFAQHAVRESLAAWSTTHVWPWQVRDGDLTTQVYTQLLQGLLLVAGEVLAAYAREDAEVRRIWSRWFSDDSTLEGMVSKRLQSIADAHVRKAVVHMASTPCVTDSAAISQRLQEMGLLPPRLSLFTVQLVQGLVGTGSYLASTEAAAAGGGGGGASTAPSSPRAPGSSAGNSTARSTGSETSATSDGPTNGGSSSGGSGVMGSNGGAGGGSFKHRSRVRRGSARTLLNEVDAFVPELPAPGLGREAESAAAAGPALSAKALHKALLGGMEDAAVAELGTLSAAARRVALAQLAVERMKQTVQELAEAAASAVTSDLTKGAGGARAGASPHTAVHVTSPTASLSPTSAALKGMPLSPSAAERVAQARSSILGLQPTAQGVLPSAYVRNLSSALNPKGGANAAASGHAAAAGVTKQKGRYVVVTTGVGPLHTGEGGLQHRSGSAPVKGKAAAALAAALAAASSASSTSTGEDPTASAEAPARAQSAEGGRRSSAANPPLSPRPGTPLSPSAAGAGGVRLPAFIPPTAVFIDPVKLKEELLRKADTKTMGEHLPVSQDAGGSVPKLRGMALRGLERLSVRSYTARLVIKAREAAVVAAAAAETGVGGATKARALKREKLQIGDSDRPPASGSSGPRPGRKHIGPEILISGGSENSIGPKETFRESFRTCSCFSFMRRSVRGYFWAPGVPALLNGVAVSVPLWQSVAASLDKFASAAYLRVAAKRSTLGYALQNPGALSDVSQLVSLLVHPLYRAIPRPDRPWTLSDALWDLPQLLVGRSHARAALHARKALPAVRPSEVLSSVLTSELGMRVTERAAVHAADDPFNFPEPPMPLQPPQPGVGGVPTGAAAGPRSSVRSSVRSMAGRLEGLEGVARSRSTAQSYVRYVRAPLPAATPAAWGTRGPSVASLSVHDATISPLEEELDAVLDVGLGPDVELLVQAGPGRGGSGTGGGGLSKVSTYIGNTTGGPWSDMHSLVGPAGSTLYGILTTGLPWTSLSYGDIQGRSKYRDRMEEAAASGSSSSSKSASSSIASCLWCCGGRAARAAGGGAKGGTGRSPLAPLATDPVQALTLQDVAPYVDPARLEKLMEKAVARGTWSRPLNAAAGSGSGSGGVGPGAGDRGTGKRRAFKDSTPAGASRAPVRATALKIAVEHTSGGTPIVRSTPNPMFTLRPHRCAPAVDHMRAFARQLRAAHSCATEWYEENRALAHFAVLLMAYGRSRRDAHMARFPAFFDLAAFQMSHALGMQIPTHIREAAARRDLSHLAKWLSLLSSREQDTYAGAKDVFDQQMEAYKQHQAVHFATVGVAAEQMKAELEPVLQVWVDQSAKNMQALKGELSKRMLEDRFVEHAEKAARRRGSLMGTLLGDLDPLDMEDVRASVASKPVEVDEVHLAQFAVSRIERSHANCNASSASHMREHQYSDPSFPPDPTSMGDIRPLAVQDVLSGTWMPAFELNSSAEIFAAGCDPDDVVGGFVMRDNWLLAAMCMLAASGTSVGVSANAVDPLIDNIFVTKHMSPSGVCAIRLYMNGQWVPVLLDDNLPLLKGSRKPDWLPITPKCAGVAVAHSNDVSELWPSLLEKAFAKVYGSYADLSRGFLEHALLMLTGAPTRRVPLQMICDGPFRARLWRDLKAWYSECKYMLGAETFSAGPSPAAGAGSERGGGRGASVSREASRGVRNMFTLKLLPNGLAPSSVYLIHDVRETQGYRLVRLREPPGVKSDWRGAFSADSSAWTLGLVSELGFDDVLARDPAERTLWMTFDDFLTHFQSLYVCFVRDPKVWKQRVVAGAWRGPTSGGLLKPDGRTPGSLHRNPQWLLSLDRDASVTFTLQQRGLEVSEQELGVSTPSSTGGVAGQEGEGHAGGDGTPRPTKASVTAPIPCALYVCADTSHLAPVHARHDVIHAAYGAHGRGLTGAASLEPGVDVTLMGDLATVNLFSPIAPANGDKPPPGGAPAGAPASASSWTGIDDDEAEEQGGGGAEGDAAAAAAAAQAASTGVLYLTGRHMGRGDAHVAAGISSHPAPLVPLPAARATGVALGPGSPTAAGAGAGGGKAGSGASAWRPSSGGVSGPPVLDTSGAPPAGGAPPWTPLGGVLGADLLSPKTGRGVTAREVALAASSLGRETGVPATAASARASDPLPDGGDHRIFALTCTNVVATTGTPLPKPIQTLSTLLKAGRYVIIPACETEGALGGFGLIIQSTETIALKQVWPHPEAVKDENTGPTDLSALLPALVTPGGKAGAAGQEAGGKESAVQRSTVRAQHENEFGELEDSTSPPADEDEVDHQRGGGEEGGAGADASALALVKKRRPAGPLVESVLTFERKSAWYDSLRFAGGLLGTASHVWHRGLLRLPGITTTADGSVMAYVRERAFVDAKASIWGLRGYGRVRDRVLRLAIDDLVGTRGGASGGSWRRTLPDSEVENVMRVHDLPCFHHSNEVIDDDGDDNGRANSAGSFDMKADGAGGAGGPDGEDEEGGDAGEFGARRGGGAGAGEFGLPAEDGGGEEEDHDATGLDVAEEEDADVARVSSGKQAGRRPGGDRRQRAQEEEDDADDEAEQDALEEETLEEREGVSDKQIRSRA